MCAGRNAWRRRLPLPQAFDRDTIGAKGGRLMLFNQDTLNWPEAVVLIAMFSLIGLLVWLGR